MIAVDNSIQSDSVAVTSNDVSRVMILIGLPTDNKQNRCVYALKTRNR